MKKRVWLLLACVFLTACDDGANYAPVVDASIESIPKSGVHRVNKGETLYEIAWRYGLDYRYLAKKNNIQAPYAIRVGQVIYFRRQAPLNLIKENNKQMVAQVTSSSTLMTAPVTQEPNFSPSVWMWPTQGRIVNAFSGVNKGINITGYAGQPIVATAAGKVVYAGQGLRGYGNLIIIKHNSVFLSAYAHNKRVFVQEGSWVKQGQKIAEMGDSGSDKVMLHFEIRRAGKPIDPTSILQGP